MQAFRTVLNNKIENFVDFPVFSGGFTKFVNQDYFKAILFLLNFYKQLPWVHVSYHKKMGLIKFSRLKKIKI